MNIKTFTDALIAAEIDGVYDRLDYIPRELDPRRLPAQWVDMPAVNLVPEGAFGTFEESGAQYTTALFIAHSPVIEAFPAEQRAAVLELACAVEAWAAETTYTVQVTTGARIPVGSREYRGVVARISANEDVN